MNRIVTTRDWEGTLSELQSAAKVFGKGDRIYVDGEKSRYKVGNGKDTFANLPWIYSGVKNLDAVAINATATATAKQLATGLVTSTSAAATSITLPSAQNLLAEIGGKAKSTFELIVDNSAGESTVTIVASASITAATAVVTGGATLTVASGAVGIFKIYFSSGTVAKIYRIG